MSCKVEYGIFDGELKRLEILFRKERTSALLSSLAKDISVVLEHRHFCGYRYCCRYLNLRNVYRGWASGHMGVLAVD